MVINNAETRTELTGEEARDYADPIEESEAFDSIWQALRWTQVRKRIPVCFKRTIRSRYMLANLVYFVYATGILIIDFNPYFNGSDNSTVSSSCYDTSSDVPLDQPVCSVPAANDFYLALGILHLISAFLYWWSWHDRKWYDVIMIPEYLNHIEAALYIWSASWYSREDTLGGYYTLAVHRIEMTAATVELIASFGWIMSWYMTYVRTLGRGFTLDDPDTVAWAATTISSFVYMVYNIQINVDPTQYGTNLLYTNGDIVYFIGSCYYIFAVLRDENWFWFLPVCGQYRVAPGKIRIEATRSLPIYGKTPVLMTTPCKCLPKKRIAPQSEEF